MRAKTTLNMEKKTVQMSDLISYAMSLLCVKLMLRFTFNVCVLLSLDILSQACKKYIETRFSL